jgi:hypothetical protein
MKQSNANANNHSNQCNPNNAQCCGGSNHANQMNPNNAQYGGGNKGKSSSSAPSKSSTGR